MYFYFITTSDFLFNSSIVSPTIDSKVTYFISPKVINKQYRSARYLRSFRYLLKYKLIQILKRGSIFVM